jgi:hypothetical protein
VEEKTFRQQHRIIEITEPPKRRNGVSGVLFSYEKVYISFIVIEIYGAILFIEQM